MCYSDHQPRGGEGTQGFVLNRVVGERTLEDLMPSPDFHALRDVRVYEGGPVAADELILMALRWNEKLGKLETRSPLGIAGAVRARTEGWEVRAFTGYTGWGAGQLEGELKESAWIIADPCKAALSADGGTPMWSDVLREMDDPRRALLADLPEDPGLN